MYTGHKRKRSLQDTPVDLTKMRQALKLLNALKEELEGFDETEEDMQAVMNHIAALGIILKGAKRPKISFSCLNQSDLKSAGIVGHRLVFNSPKVSELAQSLDTLLANAREEVNDLYGRLKKIYKHVNMDYEAGARMILDAILLSLAEIVPSVDARHGVAILPEMRIGSSEGVQVVNSATSYEIWLHGHVDYAVLEFEDALDNRERLLSPGGSRAYSLEVTSGRIFLVEAKRRSEGPSLASFVPEAVGQAIGLMREAGVTEIRFCLSDGQGWIFFLAKYEDDKYTYYESVPRYLMANELARSDATLREILGLVIEWLTPRSNDLFQLVTNKRS